MNALYFIDSDTFAYSSQSWSILDLRGLIFTLDVLLSNGKCWYLVFFFFGKYMSEIWRFFKIEVTILVSSISISVQFKI